MTRLLDTDVLIDVLRGNRAAIEWFSGLDETPVVPGFVALELIHGCENAQDARIVNELIAPLRIVWPTATDCERIRGEFSMLHLRHGVGVLDALIAACAIGLNAVFHTFNEKHYRAISGMKIEAPYSRDSKAPPA